MSQNNEKAPLIQRLSEDATSAITELIYEKVESLLGAGDELFTMEFPARPLNQNAYKYDTDGSYSLLTKPITVAEAEFNLSDALYDTAPIVQASNGENLSVVYSDLLNNYVPKLDFLKDFVTDKNHLREWLLTEVADVDFDKNNKGITSDKKISRMALCKKLYGIYLEERNKWYKEKNEGYRESRDDELKLEEYVRWVNNEGLVRDEELNNLFNKAVARGNYYEVMTILGFLNAESPAETLEKTKQNMRTRERRDLNGSGSVYPVQFEPTDWFKTLEPNLHPKDLTMSIETLIAGTISQSVEPTTDVPASEEEEKQSALLPESNGGADSTFMDVVLSSESISKRYEENASSSSHHQASAEDTSKIEIGFRVMKVSINRGQWFTPNVFKMTQNFYRLSESKCAPGINKDDIRNAISKTDADAQLKKLLSYTIDNKKCSYLLPSYPTAFVIAKDITIRVQVSHDEMEENKEYAESQSSTSGGLFGFSASSASGSKNCSESSYVGAHNNFIYIRIPGPQILGWFQQLVPADASEKYEPMKDVPYKDVLKSLNESTNPISSITPSSDTESSAE